MLKVVAFEMGLTPGVEFRLVDDVNGWYYTKAKIGVYDWCGGLKPCIAGWSDIDSSMKLPTNHNFDYLCKWARIGLNKIKKNLTQISPVEVLK